MKRTTLLLTAGIALALAGCGKKADDSAAKAAGGEILPATVSDAMLDTDRSQAQPPLLAVKPTGSGKAAEAAPPSDAASEGVAESAPDAAQAPAATPAAAASAQPASKPATKPAAKPAP